MSIVGVNHEKCSVCKQCISDCTRGLFQEDSNGKVIRLADEMKSCNFCGKCVAICKENAILWEGNWEDDVESYPGVKNYEENVSYENLMQLLKAKRSVRQYKIKKVPEELLKKVFEAMRYASSADNRRAWKFSVVSDPSLIKTLSQESIKIIYPYMGFPTAEAALKYSNSINKDPIFRGAPAVIFLTATSNVSMPQVDAGIILTYGQLAAHTLGLATCWIGMAHGLGMNKEMMKVIGLEGQIQGVLTIGYPAVKYYRTPPRAPLDVVGLE
ncbi:MAG: nitroreductase family protein [Promethearchaeota archaeon]|jgi:nitroreductase/NAD-dependent dihydropyrimidine dehydrogenase PreA subunit